MADFKLDRTAFKAQTTREAADHDGIYKKMTWQERLMVAAYLNSNAYGFDLNHPPKLERSIFSVRSRSKR
jgi:hypothetical protein